ncbi:unnamed protein product [Gongylonema pulchrum]|uniref:C2H2-type domain-containing protein n=1 Tax=Gongylonema pulchrum TaxID=637853 RepID=A0A3P7QEV2_9BILA|nr:unnamed protein product [Gongylonema pulchrum]
MRRHIREMHGDYGSVRSCLTEDDGTLDDGSTVTIESGSGATGSSGIKCSIQNTGDSSAADSPKEKFVNIDGDEDNPGMTEVEVKSLGYHSSTGSPEASDVSDSIVLQSKQSVKCVIADDDVNNDLDESVEPLDQGKDVSEKAEKTISAKSLGYDSSTGSLEGSDVSDSIVLQSKQSVKCVIADDDVNNDPEESVEPLDQEKDVSEKAEKTISAEAPSFIYTETGEYSCQKCDKIFGSMHNARRHWNRVHLKCYTERKRSKKLTCKFEDCAQRFPCLSKLQDHLSSAHSEDALIECETCAKKFRTRAQFAVHLRRYHLVSIKDAPAGFAKQS